MTIRYLSFVQTMFVSTIDPNVFDAAIDTNVPMKPNHVTELHLFSPYCSFFFFRHNHYFFFFMDQILTRLV